MTRVCDKCQKPLIYTEEDLSGQGGPPENTWFCTNKDCSSKRQFYLWSVKWSQDKALMVWWGPNARGYTSNLDNAGLYSEDEIKKHIDPTLGLTVIAVPAARAMNLSHRVVENTIQNMKTCAKDSLEPAAG